MDLSDQVHSLQLSVDNARVARDASNAASEALQRFRATLEAAGCTRMDISRDHAHFEIRFDCHFPEGTVSHVVDDSHLYDSRRVGAELEFVAQNIIRLIEQRRDEGRLDLPTGPALWDYYLEEVQRMGFIVRGYDRSFGLGGLFAELNLRIDFRITTVEIDQFIRYGDLIGDNGHSIYHILISDLVAVRSFINTNGDPACRIGQDSSIRQIRWTVERVPFYGDQNIYYCNLDDQTKEDDDRAKALLLSCLSPKQRKDFEAKNRFNMTGQSGKEYTVKYGKVYNVTDEDGVQLCAGPSDNVPVCDYLLAQKLWLETDEAGFLAVANRKGDDGWLTVRGS